MDALIGQSFQQGDNTYTIAHADNFSYLDPIDKSVSNKQGLRLIFDDSSRIIFRLSGTGTSGATIRIYFDRFIDNPEQLQLDSQVALADLMSIAANLTDLKAITGREHPDVIT